MSTTERPRSARRKLGDVLETLVLAVGIYLGVQLTVPPYAVDGPSMAPTLADGERLLVNRPVYAHVDTNAILRLIPGVEVSGQHIVYPFDRPQRGDIVVFTPPGPSEQPYIKRVIGVAGDEISFADGSVLVDGERLEEPYQARTETSCSGASHCRLTVPAGAVYVLGDNRTNSVDSRDFGPISTDAIVGKAWFAHWPLERFGLIPSVTYEP